MNRFRTVRINKDVEVKKTEEGTELRIPCRPVSFNEIRKALVNMDMAPEETDLALHAIDRILLLSLFRSIVVE